MERKREIPGAQAVLCDSAALAPRNSVNASKAEATIKNKLTAVSTGVAPSRMRPYIITVSGAS